MGEETPSGSGKSPARPKQSSEAVHSVQGEQRKVGLAAWMHGCSLAGEPSADPLWKNKW